MGARPSNQELQGEKLGKPAKLHKHFQEGMYCIDHFLKKLF